MQKRMMIGLMLLCVWGMTEARQERSQAAKNDFKRSHPCPVNGSFRGPCPGYVIDHITPLACGGADAPDNMQWQTVAEGKNKDKWERKGCSTGSNGAGRQSLADGAYHLGPRGGCYTLNGGKKVYVDHALCGR